MTGQRPTTAAREWQRVNDLFHAALEREPRDRPAFLGDACAIGSEGVRGQVERLLAAEASAGAFLADGASAFAPLLADEDDASAVGRQIGAYVLVRELGRGGMGAVYLAERADDEYRKRVAIKLIKRGMDTDAVLRHFRNERQILASLEHPHIARLIDGGTTDDGLPYFVMEYVEGTPIDRYCEARGLSITERLDLFRRAGAAVAYAHQHLVVHRDIKPSNVLVDGEGVPKLLDFGIAKILDPEAGRDAPPTATGLRMMTPAYASPEQVQGLPVTTLTDVYSLGVVLYEMLAGGAPHALTGRSPQEAAERIRHAEPARPSLVARPAARRRLRGDLDNIVLMALRKDPARRYRSVEHLCEDIRRHLAGLPVSARQETLAYRAAKFVGRNRRSVAAAAVVAATLAGGVVTTTWQARRARAQQAIAERRFEDVRKLAHAVLFDYHDAIKSLPGATPVRERLVKDALEYLDALAREAHDDRSLQREMASAYERVGDVQGELVQASLGDTAGALLSQRKALAVREALAAVEPTSAVARRDLARSLQKVGMLLSETGDVAGSIAQTRRAADTLEALASESPADGELRYELAFAHDAAGTVSLDAGEVEKALAQHRRAIALYEALDGSPADGPRVRRDLSAAYGRLGQALIETGDLEQALRFNAKGIVLREALVREFPLDMSYLHTLTVGHYNAGDIFSRMGRQQESVDAFGAAAAIGRQLVDSDPRSGPYRSSLAYALLRQGEGLGRLGRPAEGLLILRRSLALREADIGDDPTSLWKRAAQIETHARIALMQAHLGRRAAAGVAATEATALMQATPVEESNVVVAGALAHSQTVLGDTFSALASDPAAADSLRREWWGKARTAYARSREFWDRLHARGLLSTFDQGQPAALAGDVARCDAALTRLR